MDLDVDEDPEVQIDNDLISKAVQKFQIDKNKTNILLGIGGSGPTKEFLQKLFKCN